ncbi:MAG: hypothetical protein HRU25_16435 [Psychrobium sp.]|nr:hypothetical protein [Psychrobium sp.]
MEANEGLVAGEFVRVSNITDIYPNVVVVPEPLSNIALVAFSLRPDIDLSQYKIDHFTIRWLNFIRRLVHRSSPNFAFLNN